VIVLYSILNFPVTAARQGVSVCFDLQRYNFFWNVKKEYRTSVQG